MGIISEIIKIHRKKKARILLTNCDTPLNVLQGVGENGPNQGVKYVLILCVTCPTKKKLFHTCIHKHNIK